MIRFFAYIGAALFWLGQRFNTTHKQQTFREILFGANIPENGFSKFQDRPVLAGIGYVLIVCIFLLMSIFK